MFKNRAIYGGLFAVIWLLASICSGCAHHAATQVATQAPTTGSNLSPMDAGRTIFTSACHGCHATPSINNYTSANWTNNIIPSMGSKAGLGSTDRQNLQTYVLSVKNGSGSP